jgi:hypothetical protein
LLEGEALERETLPNTGTLRARLNGGASKESHSEEPTSCGQRRVTNWLRQRAERLDATAAGL